MKLKSPKKVREQWDLASAEGPCRDLGPAPASYTRPHRVVKVKRTGLIERVPTEELEKL